MLKYKKMGCGYMKEIVIITGLSGSGKTTVIEALEDIGYHIIENLPPLMIHSYIFNMKKLNISRIALVVDLRFESFFNEAIFEIKKITKDHGLQVRTIFVTANDDVIFARFKESRRAHPLGNDLITAMNLEKNYLVNIREIATNIIDTSYFSRAQAKKHVLKIFEGEQEFKILIKSFGFKYATPKDADYIFDLRFLQNPFYVKELRPLTGESLEVAEYVMNSPNAEEYYVKIDELIKFVVPKLIDEGRLHVVICFGCTGGKHRSVAFAERFAKELKKSYKIELVHIQKK